MALSGPTMAPAVSMAWRKPNPAPRCAGSRESAIRASRGAARNPLAARSAKRIQKTCCHECVTASRGFTMLANVYPAAVKGLRRPSQVGKPAGKQAGETGNRLRRALDQAKGHGRRAQHRDQELGQKPIAHLRRGVIEERHPGESPHIARQASIRLCGCGRHSGLFISHGRLIPTKRESRLEGKPFEPGS